MLRELAAHLRDARRGRDPMASHAPHIAILGTGFAGLGMAIRLKQAGIDSFTIYEKADGVGGTWRDNTYPGAACDVPSHLYSFSFDSFPDWTRKFSPQPEILAYLEHCADAFGLRPHIRFGTEISAAAWDDEAQVWRLRTTTGEEHTAHALVSGLGQLNLPAYPDLPGLDTFAGTAFHSSRWDHGHDLAGRKIAVIGNGASALQFVPEIQPQADRLYQFQRSANWILPKPDGAFTEKQRARFHRHPILELAYRRYIYLMLEWRFHIFHDGNRLAPMAEKLARRYLDAQVKDPAVRAVLTPDFPVGCKRLLMSNDYFAALTAPNAEVVATPIESIVPDGIVTADGTHREVDTIIFGTGFQSTSFLAPVEITGRDGVRLTDVWKDGAEAYLGVTVAGFPNLFLCYGPNTNLGHNSIVFMIECQVHYTLACLRRLMHSRSVALDVKPEVMAAYNRDLQAAMHGTVWEAGCHSWYKTATGKVVNNWPHYTVEYWLKTREPDFAAYDFVARRPAREPVGLAT